VLFAVCLLGLNGVNAYGKHSGGPPAAGQELDSDSYPKLKLKLKSGLKLKLKLGATVSHRPGGSANWPESSK